MNPSLDRISAAVAAFYRWVQLPRCPELQPKLMLQFSLIPSWSDPYLVDASLPGCYIFENDAGELYYVGSVSASSSFGYRFANGYVCKHPDDPTKALRSGNAEHARRIYVVAVPREYAFIAPALEQFLITFLASSDPLVNKKDAVPALRQRLLGESEICTEN
jgi:hypothetical protein